MFVLACWPGCAQAQKLGGGGASPDISIIRILAALLVCLAAAFALALVIRARKGSIRPLGKGWLPGAMAGSRRIEIVETRRATPYADICLVRCDGEEYLLLCGPSGQSVLRWPRGERPATEEHADVD
jgi:hypothetical protein